MVLKYFMKEDTELIKKSKKNKYALLVVRCILMLVDPFS